MSGIFVTATGTLGLPGSELSLSGTSADFGALTAGALDLAGAAILGRDASIGGEISIGPAGLLDFGGTLIAGADALSLDQQAVTLAANAVLTGSGTLVAGNFADPGLMTGPGTILAAGGDSLLVAAGSISGRADLQVDGGGVLVLGPRTPVAGLFGTTALTVDNSVTLGFGSGYGVVPVTGVYADSLAADGGVIVIDDPLSFEGTVTGFSPGDQVVFPGLTGLTLSGVTSQGFEVTGRDSANQTEQFTLHAAIPAGATLAVGTDAEGDAEIGLRVAAPALYIDGSSIGAGRIDAGAGVGQPLLGLQVLLPNWTSQSLTLTLSVGEGDLADGTVVPAAQLVLTAANPIALNSLLSEIVYTASLSASVDTLTVTGNSGLLAGLSASVAITIESAGTVSGFAAPPTAEQVAVFTGSTAAAVLVTAAAAPGEISITGAADFADLLAAGGIGGTALIVDGGGIGIFDAAAQVTLAGDAIIGDAGGAGTLGIVSTDFVIGSAGANADLVVGDDPASTGSDVEITGALTVNGAVLLGQLAAARLDLSGTLNAAAVTIDTMGTLAAGGTAAASLGDLVDSGTLQLENGVQATAQALVLAGLLDLGGDASLSGLSSAVIASGGSLVVAQDAEFSAFGLNAVGGNAVVEGTLLLSGNLQTDAAIGLSGGAAQAASVTLAPNAVLSGTGDLVADGAGATIALQGSEILASGGRLELDGNVALSSGASIVIAGSAALDLVDGAAGGEISFAGAGATLTVNDLAMDSTAVAGMLAGDFIDLIGVSPSQVSFAGGTISATGSGGHFLGGFGFTPASLQPTMTIVSDGSAGALIELACFVRGTRLLTPNGYVPVEEFKPGDPIITRGGIRRAVRWIGRRDMAIGLQVRQDIRPVLVLPGAMGPGIPGRAVRLSPSHAVFIDNVLVPVMHLVNGATILREKRSAVTYFHIELDRHDVLMAEGLPVESYLDTGNRGEFRHELGLRGSAARTCAPLVTAGAKLARIRRHLHSLALQAGFSLRREPELRGIAGEMMIAPQLRQRGAVLEARFELPRHAGRLLLLASSAAPADTDPDSGDRRELAICLRQPRPKQRRLALGQGWYRQAPGDAGTWMSGSGEILLPAGVGELTLKLAAVVQSWRRPAG